MDEPYLLLLTGPPGAGKTSVSALVAADAPLSTCVHADWFWTTIVKGHELPWEPQSHHQNRVMLRGATATAARMVAGGYRTVLDGILGPWQFDVVLEELRDCSAPVHYVILRPDLSTCLARATARTSELAHRDALSDPEPIASLWRQFADLGAYEHHVLDSTHWDLARTAREVHAAVASDRCRLAVGVAARNAAP